MLLPMFSMYPFLFVSTVQYAHFSVFDGIFGKQVYRKSVYKKGKRSEKKLLRYVPTEVPILNLAGFKF